MSSLYRYLTRFVPHPLVMDWRERLSSCLGAAIGLLLTGYMSLWALGHIHPWLIAPMGASAVLLFAAPASPLAQPWNMLLGNLVSALIGVLCAQLIGTQGGVGILAAGLACGLAIAAMLQLRCLHPPGGAVALTAVLGGPTITSLGYGFAVWPVALNTALLLLVALGFNSLAGRRYPHQPSPAGNGHGTSDPKPSARLGLTSADLDAALQAHREWLDIDKGDLQAILLDAETRAYRRRFGDIRCRDIMSRDIVHLTPSTPCSEAWTLLRQHRIKALPVLNPQGQVLGIVTLHDFLITPDGQTQMHPQQETLPVASIMTTQVLTTQEDQTITDLVQPLSDGGMHHLPVLNHEAQLVGMLTQSDLIAALYRAGLEYAGAGKNH
ncbi:HPP family protein [Chitinimonas sp. JJ19]|uniref:HPP family protein n=1 Tax=Chitinimonas sp. JJ19 TaxID=3109352 RepID=UPI00300290B0